MTDGEAPFAGIRHLHGLFDVVPVVGLEPTRGISPTDFEFCSPHRSTRLLDELSGTCYPQKSL